MLMKTKREKLLAGLILLGSAWLSVSSQGQVDPVWLGHWNEAQVTRPATLTSTGRIADENEPGIPMIIRGVVLQPDRTPASGVIVHAYQRDRDGFEFGSEDKALKTWRLQGWVMTDDRGMFEFRTTRPAADHLGREAAHIHFTLDSEEFGRQWVKSVFLSDDPLVTAAQRRESKKAGEFGRVRQVKTIKDVQHIEVKIQLKAIADF